MALTSLAFLLAFLGGLGLCVVRGPIWGLYTYIGVFYLHPPSRWWGMYLPDLRWSLLAAAVTFICILARGGDPNRKPFMSHGLPVIFLLYVIWMWMQIPFVISNDQLSGAVLFSKYFLLLYLIYALVDSDKRLRDFLLVHVAGCFYMGWLAYVAVAGGRLEGVGGPGIDDSNSMSMHLATGIVAGAVLLMTERKWRFWFVLLAMPFMLNGMVQGASRGAFLGLLAGGAALFLLKPPAYRRHFIVFGVLGLILFGYLANDVFLTRINSLRAVTSEEQELDRSALSRIAVMEAQWRMFLDHPWGAGHFGTDPLSPSYLAPEYLARSTQGATPRRSSHNTFMSVVVDQGVPGIVLVIALIIWVWRTAEAVTKRSSLPPHVWGYCTAIVGALVVAAVAGQFAPYLKAEIQIWLLGLLLAATRLTKPEVVNRLESKLGGGVRSKLRVGTRRAQAAR